MQKVKELPQIVKEFLVRHALCSFATVSSDNKPHLANVFYMPDVSYKKIYISSRKQSDKIRNIIINPHVALAVVNLFNLSTLQMEGTAKVVKDKGETADLLENFNEISTNASGFSFPPTMKLKGGPLEIIEIKIYWFRYSNFSYTKPQFVEGIIDE